MIRLLHAADLHLDSAFSALNVLQSAERRQEQRRLLSQLSALCRDCDLLLLSGDLFDSTHIYRDTLDALHTLFASVKAEVFIAPGNHDYVRADSPYLTEQWEPNVHIFTEPKLTRVRLTALSCDVYGAAFTASEMPPLLRGFQVSDPKVTNLMVLHGELQANSVYNPISPEEVAASGLDYLALGHVHTAQIQTFGKTTCAQPGCPMGRGFDECGQKGVLRVQLSESGCNVKFIPLDVPRYEILQVSVNDNPLASVLAALPENTQRDCYRIFLAGEADSIDVAALEKALAPQFYTLSVLDRTVPKQALWTQCGEETLRGYFLRILKQQFDGAHDEAERHRLAAAARLGTALMDGREIPF